MTDWKDIKTAPRDGTKFDMWVKVLWSDSSKNPEGYRVTDVFYEPMPYNGWRWAVAGSYLTDYLPVDALTDYTDRDQVPTHWSELTAPDADKT